MKKTLHRLDLGCTSTFLTLSVMLRSASSDFRRDGARSSCQLRVELLQMKSNAEVSDTDGGGGGYLRCSQGEWV